MKAERLSPHARRMIRRALLTCAALAACIAFSLLFGEDILLDTGKEAAFIPAATATAPIAQEPEEAPTKPAIMAERVFISDSGTKYHALATCSGMKSAREVSLFEAKGLGYTACARCNPPE
ncbi:hypothetical protein FACS1894196_2560 [Clostridia bacterium]|nr:hypothetical protein FACS1894196_2560 [Clostridia bacterium]